MKGDMEYLIRFLIGGAVVSVFAVCGDVFRPRSFAGIFGAAPTIALASLGFVLAREGAKIASIEGRSMVIGALALTVCSSLTSYLVLKRSLPGLPSALLGLAAWFVVSLGLWALLFWAGVL